MPIDGSVGPADSTWIMYGNGDFFEHGSIGELINLRKHPSDRVLGDSRFDYLSYYVEIGVAKLLIHKPSNATTFTLI